MADKVEKMDYKKAFRDLYFPKNKPAKILVPPMTFIMVDGQGNPNAEEGAYSRAVGLLYALSYTIKMSKMSGSAPPGYFEYVVPPLEGLWWMKDGRPGVDYGNKENFCWISMIRQPEFVTPDLFKDACQQVEEKKGLDASPARLEVLEEGLCVQCMHLGSFDEEPATVAKIDAFIEENGLINDISDTRQHHEIYLSDPRKTSVDKMCTVLRIPVRLP